MLCAAVQSYVERAVRERCDALGEDFSDVWDITAARLVPLQAFLADPVATNAVEDQLVAAGLYGAELSLRCLLFDEAIEGGSPPDLLRAAGAVLRALDRVDGCPAAVGPVADLCDLLASAGPESQR
jgi:hypothetical protein